MYLTYNILPWTMELRVPDLHCLCEDNVQLILDFSQKLVKILLRPTLKCRSDLHSLLVKDLADKWLKWDLHSQWEYQF